MCVYSKLINKREKERKGRMLRERFAAHTSLSLS